MIDLTSQAQQAVAEPKVLPDQVDELPLLDYDAHSVGYIVASLRGLSQAQLRMIDVHERRNANRGDIRDRIADLTGEEPWVGYDGQDRETILRFLRKSGSAQAREVLAYECAHRDRAGVTEAAKRRLASMPA